MLMFAEMDAIVYRRGSSNILNMNNYLKYRIIKPTICIGSE